MMFLSLARNSSCVPLSCGLGLGFIPSPQNKIARFRHSTCRNLAISTDKNQQKSTGKTRLYSILNGGLVTKTDRLKPILLFLPILDGQFRNGCAVFARVGRAVVHSACVIAHHRLPAA